MIATITEDRTETVHFQGFHYIFVQLEVFSASAATKTPTGALIQKMHCQSSPANDEPSHRRPHLLDHSKQYLQFQRAELPYMSEEIAKMFSAAVNIFAFRYAP